MQARLHLLALLLLVLGTGCASSQPQCSEYRQILSSSRGEMIAGNRLQIAGSEVEIIALEVSEEGALLSKRLKTLCELIWAERISYPSYRIDVEQAYDDYERTRLRNVLR